MRTLWIDHRRLRLAATVTLNSISCTPWSRGRRVNLYNLYFLYRISLSRSTKRQEEVIIWLHLPTTWWYCQFLTLRLPVSKKVSSCWRNVFVEVRGWPALCRLECVRLRSYWLLCSQQLVICGTSLWSVSTLHLCRQVGVCVGRTLTKDGSWTSIDLVWTYIGLGWTMAGGTWRAVLIWCDLMRFPAISSQRRCVPFIFVFSPSLFRSVDFSIFLSLLSYCLTTTHSARHSLSSWVFPDRFFKWLSFEVIQNGLDARPLVMADLHGTFTGLSSFHFY